MKLVYKTFLFHLLCILLFAVVYLNISSHFHTDLPPSLEGDKYISTMFDRFIHFLYLSTTIQSGVGYSNNYPVTSLAKGAVICQQFTLISVQLITLYAFTLL